MLDVFFYMFRTAAAPPKSATIPIAPVSIGRQAPPEELEAAEDALASALVASGPIADVGVGTPEVNGSSLALVAPGNASSVVLALGVAVALPGFRTRSIT